MLIPNASELVRRRWTVRTIARCIALALGAFSVIPIVSWSIEGFMDNDFLDLWYYADRIALAAFCLIVGLITWFLQGLIVRILVPIPKGARCPRCNHNIEGMSEAVCTECGLELTPEFTASVMPGGAAGAATPDPRITPFVTANRRAIATGILRVIGVLWLCWSLLTLVDAVAMFYLNDLDFYSYAVTTLVQAILMTLIGIFITFWAHRIARFCIPMPTDPALNTPEPVEIGDPLSPTTQSGNDPAEG